MGLRSDHGIVLRSYPFGEADRVVVILSPNHGKLRAVAKGVRKTRSRFGGRLEPFNHVDLLLYEGRNLDTITQVAVLEALPRLRDDLERMMPAATMVEATDAVVQEGEPAHRVFLLLQRGLRAAGGGPLHPDLVPAFLLKLAGAIGLAPALDACAGCGATEGLERFSFSEGGAMCTRCGPVSGYRLRPGLTAYLAALVNADLGDLPEPDPSLVPDAMGVTRRFVEYHLDRKLSALAVLDD